MENVLFENLVKRIEEAGVKEEIQENFTDFNKDVKEELDRLNKKFEERISYYQEELDERKLELLVKGREYGVTFDISDEAFKLKLKEVIVLPEFQKSVDGYLCKLKLVLELGGVELPVYTLFRTDVFYEEMYNQLFYTEDIRIETEYESSLNINARSGKIEGGSIEELARCILDESVFQGNSLVEFMDIDSNNYFYFVTKVWDIIQCENAFKKCELDRFGVKRLRFMFSNALQMEFKNGLSLTLDGIATLENDIGRFDKTKYYKL